MSQPTWADEPDEPRLADLALPFTFLEISPKKPTKEQDEDAWRVLLWDERRRSFGFYYPRWIREDRSQYFFEEVKRLTPWVTLTGGTYYR